MNKITYKSKGLDVVADEITDYEWRMEVIRLLKKIAGEP